jgi:inositol hexakisphosphate/diphosphoinositol-pentakisphosphate kinase
MIAEKEAEAARRENREMLNKLRLMRDILEKWKIGGINRKLQIKPKNWEEFIDEEGETHVRATEVQLILKWGGNCKVSCCFFSSHFARFSFSLGNLTSFTSFSLHVVTKLGEKQAIQLGQRLRHEMYPDSPGGGILRLHSTFRHDLKIKTSDEGRVMKTAAAFAKGLLELEGEIPPILVSLVHKETDSLHMLDPSGNKEVRKELDQCKERINVNLQQDVNYEKLTLAEREELVGPASSLSLHEGLRKVGNPRKTLFNIHETIGELLLQLDEMLGVMASGDENRIEGGEGLKGEDDHEMALSGVKLYKGETLLELTERWRYLYGRLYDEEKDLFDLSRVPDVHDNVRFE